MNKPVNNDGLIELDLETLLMKQAIEEKTKEEQAKYGKSLPEQENETEPLFKWVGVSRFLNTPPAAQEFLFKDLLPAKIVAACFARGGTGKTTLLLQLAVSLATGADFGRFQPVKCCKVLFIGGEDSEAIFHQKFCKIVQNTQPHQNLLIRNLEIISLIGKNRFLTGSDECRNPTTTQVYRKLQRAIEATKPDVVIIDPKSRFDGLPENSNENATFFISAMEKIVTDHDLTILFSHHESKASIKEERIEASSGRGASALYDGVRWALSLAGMTSNQAKKYDISEPWKYIQAFVTKSNYAEKWSHSEFFKRDSDGILHYENLLHGRNENILDIFIEEYFNSEAELTERELVKECDPNKGIIVDQIIKRIQNSYADFSKHDLKSIITLGIKNNKIKLTPTKLISRGSPKMILTMV